MEFLSPYLLWGLPLAGLPLLLYWWKFHQAPEQSYPSLVWLDENLRKQFQQTKRHRWLQVLWRITLLILFIYTLSQPVIGEGQPPARNHYLFVDNSMSMEAEDAGRSLFEEAQAWIDQYESALGSNTRILMGKLLPEPKIIGRIRNDQRLDTGSIRTRPGTASLSEVTGKIKELNIAPDDRVVVITDAQRSFFDSADPRTPQHPIRIQIPFKPPPNYSIQRSAMNPQPLFFNQTGELSWKTRPKLQTPEWINISGDTLYPGQNNILEWKAKKTGTHKITVKLPPDSLGWDNRWFNLVTVQNQLQIFTLGKSRAVSSLIHLLGDQAKTVSGIEKADLILVGTTAGDKNIDSQPLPQQLPDIPRLIITGAEIDRRWLARLDSRYNFPWQIEGKIELDRPTSIVRKHTERFRWKEEPSSNRLPVYHYYRIQGPSSQTIPANIEGEPVLAGVDPWWIHTLPPNQFVSPERASAEWPNYLLTIVQNLVRDVSNQDNYVGETFDSGHTLSYPITVDPPEGESFRLDSPQVDWKPQSPGFYRLVDQENQITMIAVNYDPAEGNLQSLPREEWPSFIEPQPPIDTEEFRISLSPWLWLLLLAGLGMDVWFSHTQMTGD